MIAKFGKGMLVMLTWPCTLGRAHINNGGKLKPCQDSLDTVSTCPAPFNLNIWFIHSYSSCHCAICGSAGIWNTL